MNDFYNFWKGQDSEKAKSSVSPPVPKPTPEASVLIENECKRVSRMELNLFIYLMTPHTGTITSATTERGTGFLPKHAHLPAQSRPLLN